MKEEGSEEREEERGEGGKVCAISSLGSLLCYHKLQFNLVSLTFSAHA